MLMQDVRKYFTRVGNQARRDVVKKVFETWLKLLAPFAPHVCEELWKRMGKNEFVFSAKWPAPDPKLRDLTVEFMDEYVENLIVDILGIKKVLKTEPKRVCIYVAQDWKWKAYQFAVSHFQQGKIDFGKLLKEVEQKLELRLYKSDLIKTLQQILSSLRKMPPTKLQLLGKEKMDEYSVLQESLAYIAHRTGMEVKIFRADSKSRYDPLDRAKLSLPLRPSLYLE